MGVIIDCKSIADKILDEIRERRERLLFTPALVTIYFQKSSYTKTIQETFDKAGLYLYKELFTGKTKSELEDKIRRCNQMPVYHGILIQTSFPEFVDDDLLDIVGGEKDVDCVTTDNLIRFVAGSSIMPPCTPQAVIEILDSIPDYSMNDLQNKIITVVGKGHVGAPLAAKLMHYSKNVYVCDRSTKDIVEYTKNSDIIISAAGSNRVITADKIKEGAIIIDVGYSVNSKEPNGYKGDVDFENVKNKASHITTVPNGVGLVTNVILARNLVEICERKKVY